MGDTRVQSYHLHSLTDTGKAMLWKNDLAVSPKTIFEWMLI